MQVLKILSDSAVPFSEDPHDDDDHNCVEVDHDDEDDYHHHEGHEHQK